MKRLIILLFICVITTVCYSQPDVSFITVVEGDDILLGSSKSILEENVSNFLADAACINSRCNSRFVIAVKPIIKTKEIIPTTPQRVKMEIDVLVRIGDIRIGKVFQSTSITLKGIGLSEEKALISCFNTLDNYRESLNNLVKESQFQIENYYCSHCDEIINRHISVAQVDNYERTIYELLSMPNACKQCYERCQQEAISIYKQHIDITSQSLYAKARTEWMKGQNAEAANRVAAIMNQIDPRSSVYPKVEELQNDIIRKLNADEKRLWNMHIKKHNDNQIFKKSLIEAVRDIGVAWAENQPQSISKTIIRSWF